MSRVLHTFHGHTGSSSALEQQGPVVVARLRPDALVQELIVSEGGSIDTEDVSMLVDTGASISMLDSRIVHRLKLRPLRPTSVIVANNTIERLMIHRASIALPMDTNSRSVMMSFEFVVAAVLPGPVSLQHHGLLGRDFLRRFELLYDGSRGTFELNTFSD